MDSKEEKRMPAANSTDGNIINDKRVNKDFHFSEEVGVIEVDWKGLFNDCKYSWFTVVFFMVALIYGIFVLSAKDYFKEKIIDSEVAKVKILEVTNYFGKKILISGQITNHIPIEVRLPQKCVVDARWLGHEIELVATKYKSQQSNIARYQFTGVENLCDSTEGYKRAKEEKQKMKEIVTKINEILPENEKKTSENSVNLEEEEVKPIIEIEHGELSY